MELYRVKINSALAHTGVLHMHWGVRRYQNPDGTLTELGKARLRAQREAERNKDPMKYASMDDVARQRYDTNLNEAYSETGTSESQVATRNKLAREWAKDDLSNTQKALDATQRAIESGKKLEQTTRPSQKPVKPLDLSNMTDQELRDAIQRGQLERQYNELYNRQPPERISKGRQAVKTTLEVGGAVLATTSSVVGIMLAMKQLRGD